jgi:hypothetical protein
VKVKEQIPGSIPINNLKPVVFIGKTAQVNLYVHLKGGKMELLEITSFACPPKIIPQCRKPMPLSDEKKGGKPCAGSCLLFSKTAGVSMKSKG